MEDTPLLKIDPDRLRQERREVDLGDQESGFGSIADATDDGARKSPGDESTAGITPPAR